MQDQMNIARAVEHAGQTLPISVLSAKRHIVGPCLDRKEKPFDLLNSNVFLLLLPSDI